MLCLKRHGPLLFLGFDLGLWSSHVPMVASGLSYCGSVQVGYNFCAGGDPVAELGRVLY